MIYQRSSALFAEAKKYIPGGVNSPVRAFKAVGGDPVFVERAKGAYLILRSALLRQLEVTLFLLKGPKELIYMM